jgi:hypothetical protein
MSRDTYGKRPATSRTKRIISFVMYRRRSCSHLDEQNSKIYTYLSSSFLHLNDSQVFNSRAVRFNCGSQVAALDDSQIKTDCYDPERPLLRLSKTDLHLLETNRELNADPISSYKN